MIPRLESLGEQFAARFQDQSVVDRYHLRPVYPPETFTFLNELIMDEPRHVLDVGCGSGNVARNLLNYAERIDAVDISRPMLERAKTLPGGTSPKLRWLHGRAEDVEVQPPYAMITAGDSLHWLDWGVVLPRFAQLLTPRGVLAMVHVEEHAMPWCEGYVQIVRRFSNNPNYNPVDLSAEFERYQLFQKQGEHVTAPIVWQQTIEDYIAAQHARSALSLDTMTAEQAAQFNAEMHTMLTPFAQNSILTAKIVGRVVWGKPLLGKEISKQS
jgi:trans-aconitate methyltransferase